MHILYNLLISIAAFGIRIISLFSPKMRLFVSGRKQVYSRLEEKIAPNDKVIWMHCASLGEFEQGVPIIKELREAKPNHKVVVSFFSPSGFENKKNTPLADATVYLPMDTRANAKKFIAAVHPSLAIFIKYEFWPNYLLELKNKNIPTFLVSGLFRKKQLFFQPYGGFMRKALEAFDHFFVQDEESQELLRSINFDKCTISGDTRFDRVSDQLKIDNSLDFAAQFKNGNICIVCGSTWPEDEEVLIDYINTAPDYVKFIIAPHKIEKEKIEALDLKISKKTLIYSQIDTNDISASQVLIIDCIGLLVKLYSYADIAYVGGAMGNTGLHNILEPATFGIPIIIGKNYDGFPEAQKLRAHAGLFSVSTSKEATKILKRLVEQPDFRQKTGIIAGHFVQNNVGATQHIISHLNNFI